MLIAFDLDGTLLDNQQRIPPSTIQTIKRLQDQGNKIAVATGRSYSACKYYAKLIQADYVASCNGALIVDEKNQVLLEQSPLPKETANAVLSMLYDYHDKLKIQWDSHQTYYTNNVLPFEQEYVDAFLTHFPQESFSLKVVDTPEAFGHFYGHSSATDEEIYQIFTFSMVKPPLEYERALERLQDFEGIQYVDFKTNYTDVTRTGVSKGNALDFLAKKNGWTKDQVMAFGDHHNDVSMMTYAGISVAMGNGEEEIKELAKHVTRENSQNGVEYFLKEYFDL